MVAVAHACVRRAVINRPRKTTEERVHSTLLTCGVRKLAPCRQLILQELTVKIWAGYALTILLALSTSKSFESTLR